MATPFRLPDEAILEPVLQTYPCRDTQIRTLATLTWPSAAPARNLVLHGTASTGKTSITTTLLSALSSAPESLLKHTIIDVQQCITSRHLFERIVTSVAEVLDPDGLQYKPRRCETLSALAVEMRTLCKLWDGEGRRIAVVLDGVDRAREGGGGMVPALARLAEIIPNLTTVYIVTAPPPSLLRTPSPSQHLLFPPYSKPEFIRILSLSPPANPLPNTTQKETNDLWHRFCAAVHDALVKSAARDLTSFRAACVALWPRFTQPLIEGLYEVKEFSKLLVRARVHFQDESLLNPGIIAVRKAATTSTNPSTPAQTAIATTTITTTTSSSKSATDLSALLPLTSRILLLCAYLAAHNAPKHDLTLFSTHHHGRKRRRGGGLHAATAARGSRKIARKLLGSHAFVMERMMAIYAAVRSEWLDRPATAGEGGLDGDVGMAMATLASLRLLMRVGGGVGTSGGGGASGGIGGSVSGDLMDRGGKWRLNVGWEVVRGLGRSIGVEIDDWLIE